MYEGDNKYVLQVENQRLEEEYIPAESVNNDFGGNSNWRGPVWFPINFMLIETLMHYYDFFGDEFKVHYPTGSDNLKTLKEVAIDLGKRLTSIFEQKENGDRPVYGGSQTFQKNPTWKDLILFYEYFHGDNGAGLGAGHQTGWTGLVAELLHEGFDI